jgi:hypothetical protein
MSQRFYIYVYDMLILRWQCRNQSHQPLAPTKPCEYVENGWDSDLQQCIEDSCSLDDGCVEELQKWVNASTVCYRKTFNPNSFLGFDYELFYGNRLPCYEGVVCNKAGGNEEAVDAVEDDADGGDDDGDASLTSSSSASSVVPAQCRSNLVCDLCVRAATGSLLSNPSAPNKCENVENGDWDKALQRCIEMDSCSLDAADGCVEELQKWIDASTVDVDALTGVPNGVVCNKAGGNEAVNAIDEKERCKVLNPPINNGGYTNSEAFISGDGSVFKANCVDVDYPSFTTALCLNKDDCSDHGKFGFYHGLQSSTATFGNTLSNDDDDEDEDEDEDDEDEDYKGTFFINGKEYNEDEDSPGEAITGNVGIFLSVSSLLYYAWL